MWSAIEPWLLRAALLAGLCLLSLFSILPVAADPSMPVAATVVPAPPVALPAPTPPPTRSYAIVNQTESKAFPKVVAYVTTTDQSGNPISGLAPANFELVEDGVPVTQHEVTATVNTEEPLAVALVLDVSGSMEGRAHSYSQQAATSFLDILRPQDPVELISFSSVVRVNVTFTTTKPFVALGISNLRAAGDTALYDAVATAVQNLAQNNASRKVAVLLSDGEDTKSKLRFEDALAIVAGKRVPVFAVGLGSSIDRKVLESLAQTTGGSVVYASTAHDLPQAFIAVADRLRSQYAISFTSGLKADGKEHKLVVRLKHGPTTAEGQGTFIAHQNPPFLDIVKPRTGRVITATEEIEVSAKPAVSDVQIAKVDFVVDGRVDASRTVPPYVHTISSVALAPGDHILKVIAYDSVGNSTSQEISFAIAEPKKPTPQPTSVPLLSPTPTPAPSGDSLFSTQALITLGSLLAAVGAIAGLVLTRRRRHPITHTCPRCGTVYTGRELCPTCALEHRRQVARRLRQIINPDGDPQQEKPERKNRP